MTCPLFTYEPSIPRHCNIDAKEFQCSWEYLISRLSPKIIKASLDGEHCLRDLSRGRSFYGRGKLLQCLQDVPGLNRVLKDVQDQNGSLLQPRGQWFQLEVAACLKRIIRSLSLEPKLEEEFQEKRRDILVSAPSVIINIECKTFLEGKKLKELQDDHSRKLFRQGGRIVVHGFPAKDSREVIATSKTGGKQISLRSSWPDEKKRIYDALIDKDSQAPPQAITILALDLFYIAASVGNMKQVLEEILNDGNLNLRNIKGFLLFEKKPVPYTEPSGFLVSTLTIKRKVCEDVASILLKQAEGECVFQ